MREVLKWNKNYETGEEVQVKCLKPNNGLIGRAKIELYREGEKVEETYTENIIIPPDVEAHNYMAAYNGVSDIELTTYAKPRPGFATMVLSDCQDEENVNNKFYRGNIIGYCPRKDQNAGNDTRRGVYNPTESYSKRTKDNYMHHHLVYDFGTSQGNGTINSLWMLKETPGNNRSLFFCANRKSGATLVGSTSDVHSDGVNLFMDKKRVSNLFEYMNGTETAKFVEGVSITTNTLKLSGERYAEVQLNFRNELIRPSDSLTKDRALIIDIFNSMGEKIETQKVDMTPYIRESLKYTSDYIQVRFVSVHYGDLEDCLNIGILWSGASCSYPKFNLPKKVFEGTMSYSEVICKYNTKTREVEIPPMPDNLDTLLHSVLPAFDISTMSNTTLWGWKDNAVAPYSVEGVVKIDDVLILSANGKYFCIYPNNEVLSSTDSFSGVYGKFRGYLRDYNALVGFKYGTYEMSTVFERCYSAHTKLPNPVTKTSADTMKIQYDYYIQIPYTYPKDGSYLPPVVEPTNEVSVDEGL